MTDLILPVIAKQWRTSIGNCHSYHGAVLSSEHSLVRSKLQLRLKLKHNQRTTSRTALDLEMLAMDGVQKQFEKGSNDTQKIQWS